MGVWREISGQRLQILPAGTGKVNLLWEHDTLPGYEVPRHQVSGTGAHWTVEQDEPLSLSPSLHCDPALGGCGLHGFTRNGSWS